MDMATKHYINSCKRKLIIDYLTVVKFLKKGKGFSTVLIS